MQCQPRLRVARRQPVLFLLLLRQWHLEHLRALPRVWLHPGRQRAAHLSLCRLSLPRPQLHLSLLEVALSRQVIRRLPPELRLPRQIVLRLARRHLRHLTMVLLSLALCLRTRLLLQLRLWLLTLWQAMSLLPLAVRPHRRLALPIPLRKARAHRALSHSLLAAMHRALPPVWQTAPLSRAGA